MPETKITAGDILDALTRASDNDVIYFRELRMGSGVDRVASRRIDLFKVHTAPSKGYLATAYEVKISRADFMRDVKDRRKQRAARLWSDYFYFATPPDLVTIDEVPDWAGLVEFQPDAEHPWERTKIVVQAPRLDKPRPTWGLLVSAARTISGISVATTANQKVVDLQRQVRDLTWRLAAAESQLAAAESQLKASV